MRIAVSFLVAVHFTCFSTPAQAQATVTRLPTSVYVSEFVSRSISDKALLVSFTDLFETQLVNSGRYKVLNRRNLHRILDESKNESYVASMRDVSAQARTRISTLEGANGLIFGEVADDADSGDVSITVTLESFDAVIHWKRSTSMKRGLVRDLASRRAAIGTLATLDNEPVIPREPATQRDGRTVSSGALELPRSCKERTPSSASDHMREIDVDGSDGPLQPFRVYCDMTHDGGGWALVAYVRNQASQLVTTDVVEPSRAGVMRADRWRALRDAMTEMLFLDERGRIAKISVKKLLAGNCTSIREADDLVSNQRIWHDEDSGCSATGQDYSMISLGPLGLYQQSPVKFDVWPYSEAFSYQSHNTMLFFVK